MINKNIKYSYNDIAIVPEVISNINHRDECNIFNKDGKLPLFTAPMTSVVDSMNFNLFEDNGINAILPRTEKLSTRIMFATNGKWAAFSLTEFEDIFCKSLIETEEKIKVLIDIANGHMIKLYELVNISKKLFNDKIEIMVGNIANPKTYKYLIDNGCNIDYIRVGIGAGSGCITSSNISIHYPMASLIEEIINIRNSAIGYSNLPKIIADGGVRNYSDIIKALALGADYVMIGGVFSKMLESAADTYYAIGSKEQINQYDEILHKNIKDGVYGKIKFPPLKKVFFGMSTKKAQVLCGKSDLKTSEGIEKVIDVEYTMEGWIENFTDYLKSAMSYTNSKTLEDFKQSEIILISNNTYNSVNK